MFRSQSHAAIGTVLALVVTLTTGCARPKPMRSVATPENFADLATGYTATLPAPGPAPTEAQMDTPATATTFPSLTSIPLNTPSDTREPASATLPPTPETSVNSYAEYAVIRGDTLTRIAQQHDTTVLAIMNVNGLIDPGDIDAGQVLLIPTGYDADSEAPIGYIQHAMAAGETLATLARSYRTSPEDILAANSAITDPSAIPIGVTLTIPVGTAPRQTHIVQTGETLYSIATRYDVELETLAVLNSINNPNHVEPGQVLILP